MTAPLVGLDLDNTLARFDVVLLEAGEELGCLPRGFRGGKRAVRDHIRSLPDGERRWQEVQALIYGRRMHRAEVYPGVADFLLHCRTAGPALVVVSHKTARARRDPDTDLRRAALDWLAANGLIDTAGSPLTRRDVYFEDTRQAKLRRIERLGCTHFVDDLAEVFADPGFPAGTARLLFAPGRHDAPTAPVDAVFADWREILGHFKGRGHVSD